MIAYLDGRITYKCPTYVILECGGIGYQVQISLHTYEKIRSLEKTRLLTHLHIREDAHVLYGFAEESEKHLFLLLLGVSGVGTSTARTMLSSMSPAELQQAIVRGNTTALENVKGIGAKTASRIILELKDKAGKYEADGILPASAHNTSREEALSALVMLGFTRHTAEQAIGKVLRTGGADASAEALIKAALKNI